MSDVGCGRRGHAGRRFSRCRVAKSSIGAIAKNVAALRLHEDGQYSLAQSRNEVELTSPPSYP